MRGDSVSSVSMTSWNNNNNGNNSISGRDWGSRKQGVGVDGYIICLFHPINPIHELMLGKEEKLLLLIHAFTRQSSFSSQLRSEVSRLSWNILGIIR